MIVDPNINKIVGTGYNGPPRNVPHCDSAEHLANVVWPQLTEVEKGNLEYKSTNLAEFLGYYKDCKTCPRKLIGALSGKRLELCSCAHAEANAIVNAAQDVNGCVMFAYCLLPCIECTKLIINAGIKTLYCCKEESDYSVGSRFLFKEAKIEVIELNQADLLQKH